MASNINWSDLLYNSAVLIYKNVIEIKKQNSGKDFFYLKQILDEVAQNTLIEYFTLKGIPVNIISEEGNYYLDSSSPIIIADPIDGTTNISRNLRPATTCLAVSNNNFFSGIFSSIVLDLYTGEFYKAEKGQGSFFCGKKIMVNKNSNVINSIISMDISKIPKFNRLNKLFAAAKYIRMLGSSAADLCYLASGVFDAHIDIRGSARATDLAAALFILQEAGGYFCLNSDLLLDMPLNREAQFEIIAASSKKLLNEIIHLTDE
ncbi:hypothetical protein JW865_09005 [Candidatus Bathyarchaeota archaeon]|nr:hypothetical protein [Candidatus Bathyarchaeota archaeon]